VNQFKPDRGYAPVQLSATVVSHCKDAAARLLAADSSILVVSISTVDGFDVASLRRDGLPEAARLPAITSSLTALGSAVSSELMIGTFENVIIESTLGRTLMMHAKGSSNSLILAVVTSKSALLGKILLVTRECLLQLLKQLEEPAQA